MRQRKFSLQDAAILGFEEIRKRIESLPTTSAKISPRITEPVQREVRARANLELIAFAKSRLSAYSAFDASSQQHSLAANREIKQFGSALHDVGTNIQRDVRWKILAQQGLPMAGGQTASMVKEELSRRMGGIGYVSHDEVRLLMHADEILLRTLVDSFLDLYPSMRKKDSKNLALGLGFVWLSWLTWTLSEGLAQETASRDFRVTDFL